MEVIKTKNRELDAAYPALVRLAEKEMTLPVLADFAELLDRLTEPLNIMNAEREIIMQNADSEYAMKQLAELAEREIGIEIVPVEIPVTEDFRLSYADLARLGGFVKIKREGM